MEHGKNTKVMHYKKNCFMPLKIFMDKFTKTSFPKIKCFLKFLSIAIDRELFVFMFTLFQFHNLLLCFRCRYFAVICVIKAMNTAPLVERGLLPTSPI
jgi:hypothetical protein